MSITVSTATSDERSEASAFIFADSAEEDREALIQDFITSITAGKTDHNQILLARESGSLIGVGILLFTDTATAFIWPPYTDNKQCAAEILKEMARRIDRSDVSIGQALIGPGQMTQRRLLSQNGFPHLTNLIFMKHALDLSHRSTFMADNLIQCETFDESENRQRFLNLLDRTHQFSHDCPVLNEIRSTEETLESHRSSGDSDQKYWYLFHKNKVDLGVLLLSEHQKDNTWEVVYMGVAPQERGKGYGAELIQYALQEAQTHGQSAVILAVDHKNSYAIKIYEKLGFTRQNSLSVHARLRSSC